MTTAWLRHDVGVLAAAGGVLSVAPGWSGLDPIAIALLCAGLAAAVTAAARRGGWATLTGAAAISRVALTPHSALWVVLVTTAMLATYLALVESVETGGYRAGPAASLRAHAPVLLVSVAAGAAGAVLLGWRGPQAPVQATAVALVGVGAVGCLLLPVGYALARGAVRPK